jgi:hypothetical protein
VSRSARENVAALEKAGIRAYVAIPNFDFRDAGFFGPGHFRYDPENDHYLCPAQQTLRLHNEDYHSRRKRYRAKPSVCNACELKARCTTSERGRVLYRPFEEDFYDRVRAYRGTYPYEKALRKRKVWVEPLFAEAKDWHGRSSRRRSRVGRSEVHQASDVRAGELRPADGALFARCLKRSPDGATKAPTFDSPRLILLANSIEGQIRVTLATL